MEPIHLNYLLVGRSGAGKSSVCRTLTGDISIAVRNGPAEVTRKVQYFEAVKGKFVDGRQYWINVIDMPGLDVATNRLRVRQELLHIMDGHKVTDINAILLVYSLTERDADAGRPWKFIEQLPFPPVLRRCSVIPLLTKYDNLAYDEGLEGVAETKRQVKQLFDQWSPEEINASNSPSRTTNKQSLWSKRVYWINDTKSIHRKLQAVEDINDKYCHQLERLVEMTQRLPFRLSTSLIQEVIARENSLIISRLMAQVDSLPYCLKDQSACSATAVRIEPKTAEDSINVFTSSVIVVMTSRLVFDHFGITDLFLGIPIGIACWNTTKTNAILASTKSSQNLFSRNGPQRQQPNNFGVDESLCKEINEVMQAEWKSFLNGFRVSIDQDSTSLCVVYSEAKQTPYSQQINRFLRRFNLPCFQNNEQTEHLAQKLSFSVVDSNSVSVYSNGVPLVKASTNTWKLPLPTCHGKTVWQPQLQIRYRMRCYDPPGLLKQIESQRLLLNSSLH